MPISRILISAVLLGVSSMALAESGTPEQRAACGPDVRHFCHKVKEADGDNAYLQCLELNRDSLSKRCSDMLRSYGK
jgi:Cysteine rich repeat